MTAPARKELSLAEHTASSDRGPIKNYRRIVSECGSPTVRIDISPRFDGSAVWVRDLDRVSMSLHGSRSMVQGIAPLRRVAGSYESVHMGLAEHLACRSETHGLGKSLTGCFNDFHRFFVWGARRGALSVAEITRQDTEGFLNEFMAAKAWESLLGADAAYAAITQSFLTDPNPRSRVAEIVSVAAQGFSFKIDELTQLAGFPVHSSKIPSGFVRICEGIMGIPAMSSRSETKRQGVSRRSLAGILSNINKLAYSADSGTKYAGLAFVPFPAPTTIAARLINRLPDARHNISLADTIRLLAEARRWMEGYAPHIIWFYQRIPDWTLEEAEGRTGALKIRSAVTVRLRDEWNALMEKQGLPGPICTLWNSNKGEKSFRDVLKALQTACGVVIGVNHGRRLNEVFGEEDRLYGVYEGCLTTHREVFERYEIRIWIEKTVRAWVTYSANLGTAKAIGILEQVLRVGRETNGGDDLRKTDEGYTKLFQLVKPAGLKHRVGSYLWHEDSRWFFELAGVPWETGSRGYYSFRRIFAQAYYYGYENADIRALSGWLAHIGIKHTFAYVTDPASRDEFDRIDRKGRWANKSMDDEIRQVGKEYLQDCLVRLIEGQKSGGGFSTYAIRVFRALMKRLKFKGTPIEQANALATWFEVRGYEVEPFPHGACLAGKNTVSRRKGKCFDSVMQVLDKSKASAILCHGCPHLYTNEGYLESDREELSRLATTMNDPKAPEPVRKESGRAYAQLAEIMALESKLQSGNVQIMRRTLEQIARDLKEMGDA